MARPKKLEKDKKIFVPITLDKNIYNNLKNQGYKISTYINQMLKIALDSGSRENADFYDPNLPTLVRTRSRVQISSGAYR
jgi:hypothetical protein